MMDVFVFRAEVHYPLTRSLSTFSDAAGNHDAGY
jgi:hypothetical protein